MSRSVIAWNVRGLGNEEKRSRIKRLLRRQKPSVVGLMETKWDTCNQGLVVSISGSRNVDWVAKNATNSRGGTIIYWEDHIFKKVASREGNFSISVVLEDMESKSVFNLLIVYGPHRKEEKIAFLEELKEFCQSSTLPVCIAGDFNLVRSQEDYQGADRSYEMMREFNACISDTALMDMPLTGSLFTFSNMQEHPTLSRIDRVLVCPQFDSLFNNCRVTSLERVESDHCPLKLEWGKEDRFHRYWKFENVWLLEETFADKAFTWWSCHPSGCGDLFLFGQKQRLVKEQIRRWNKEEFGKIETKIAEALDGVKRLDLKEEYGVLSEEERIQHGLLKSELARVLRMEETLWRQKSRQEELKRAFVDHFSRIYGENKPKRPFPARYGRPQISENDKNVMTRPFTEAEIWKAVKSCKGDKAPGPDGFTLAFFKKCWEVIKSDLLKAFEDFYKNGRLPKCISHSFLCLIPKKDAYEEARDFRPISLLGSVNKLISKTLTDRLKLVMKNMISGNQFAGLRGLQIHEAALIANELVDSRKKSRRPGLLFKLDIEKAFDNVNWECLFKILSRFGLPQQMQMWIRGLVSSPFLSVLVNGEAAGFFRIRKGLRQGDPMSPFLFNLVMDVLSDMLERLRGAGLISGFFMDEANSRGEVTHLLYADDTLVFCDADEEQVLNLLATLVCFQTVTGLKVNMEKSQMHPVGNVEDPGRFASLFGCGWSILPTVYLGLPLGASPNSVSIWNPILTNFQNRLEGWRGKFLSLGGRITLSSSTLSNQPLFFCSLLRAPRKVTNRLEQWQRSFIWSGVHDKGKYHLLNCNSCKAFKENGGLGVIDLASMNSALLAKWLWKFAVDKGVWWRQLIQLKFPNPLSSWKPGKGVRSVGCSCWSSIMKEEDFLWNFAYISPGGGAWISFWHDCWIQKTVLAESFPRIAAASAVHNGWVNVGSKSQCWILGSVYV